MLSNSAALVFSVVICVAGFSDGFSSLSRATTFGSIMMRRPTSFYAAKQKTNDGELFSIEIAVNAFKKKSTTATEVVERFTDTMKSAGFEEDEKPLKSSTRSVLITAIIFSVIRIFRAKVLLKQSILKRQPNWNFVITNPEQEKVLHAWTCKECGTTMFIAKGREKRFFNRFVQCYNCGAKGKDSFYDRRDDILKNEDTDFEYESPDNYMNTNDFLAKGEQKKEKKTAKAKAAASDDDGGVAVAEIVDVQTEEIVAEEAPKDDDVAKVDSITVSQENVKVEAPVVEKQEKAKPISSDSLDILDMDQF